MVNNSKVERTGECMSLCIVRVVIFVVQIILDISMGLPPWILD
jgi:hypothetical protein